MITQTEHVLPPTFQHGAATSTFHLVTSGAIASTVAIPPDCVGAWVRIHAEGDDIWYLLVTDATDTVDMTDADVTKIGDVILDGQHASFFVQPGIRFISVQSAGNAILRLGRTSERMKGPPSRAP